MRVAQALLLVVALGLAVSWMNQRPARPLLRSTRTWSGPHVKSSALKYYQVRVYHPSPADLVALNAMGGEVTPNHERTEAVVLFSEPGMALFRRDFGPYHAHTVESDDLAASTESWLIEEKNKVHPEPGSRETLVRQNFDQRTTISNDWVTAGSMGGYRTKAEIDALVAEFGETYQDIITKGPDSIGTTGEGHDIHRICIGTAGKPQSLMVGMHHAREGMSVVVPMYFLKHVGDNYRTDEELGYFMREHELCFVPQLNPDGYLINEGSNPNGGGLHRKNANLQDRCTGTPSNPGVDLNRNYDINHGDAGASSDCTQNDYHGVDPFSENESKALRDLILAEDFKTFYSYHGYGGFLIHPDSSSSTPNEVPGGDLGQALLQYGAKLVSRNNYDLGNAQATVGYSATGAADDWACLVEGIISYTPEVGNYPLGGTGASGFWPSTATMLRDAEENLFDAYEITFMAGPYFEPLTLDVAAAGDTLTVTFALKNIGQGNSNGDVTVTIEPKSGASDAGAPVNLGALAARATGAESSITVKGGAEAAFNLVAKDESGFAFTTSVKWDGTEAATAVCYHGEAGAADTCVCEGGFTGDRCQICPNREECVEAPAGAGPKGPGSWVWVLVAVGVLCVVVGAGAVVMYSKRINEFNASIAAEDAEWEREKMDRRPTASGRSRGTKGSRGTKSSRDTKGSRGTKGSRKGSTASGSRRASRTRRASNVSKTRGKSKGSIGNKHGRSGSRHRMTQATSRTRK